MDRVILKPRIGSARIGRAGVQGPAGPDGWAEPIQLITTSGPSLVIDYSLGKHVVLQLQHDVALTVIGWPSADRLARLTIEVMQAGDHTITFPSAWLWSAGAIPDITPGAGSSDVLLFTTVDAGATVRGHVIGQAYQSAN